MLKYQIVKSLIDQQVKDLLKTSDVKIKKENVKSTRQVKGLKKRLITFSEQMARERDELQGLLNEKLYHHYRVERMTSKAKRIITDLFATYEKNLKQLPYSTYDRNKKYSQPEKYEVICNHIAGMTDRSALDEHKRLFNPYEKV
jgi:dGTPase